LDDERFDQRIANQADHDNENDNRADHEIRALFALFFLASKMFFGNYFLLWFTGHKIPVPLGIAAHLFERVKGSNLKTD
jgi:heme/copper-type cytochrome/quinol oxidase subunit 3